MKCYTQLNEFERVRIYEGLKKGWGPTAIGESIGRHKSSISRELKRNSDHIGYLYPRNAHKKTKDRKARYGPKIERHSQVRNYLLGKLNKRWSPKVIAGRWKRDNPEEITVTAEAIYSWIYDPKNKDLELWKLLPKAKSRRGRTRKKYKKGTKIMHRVSIHQRPDTIKDFLYAIFHLRIYIESCRDMLFALNGPLRQVFITHASSTTHRS